MVTFAPKNADPTEAVRLVHAVSVPAVAVLLHHVPALRGMPPTIPAVSVSAPVTVVAGVIVTAPVLTDPMPIVPVPLALIVTLAAAPESIAASATVTPVAAPVTFKPAAWLPVELSTWNAGFVAPARPTASAAALADVMVSVVVPVSAAELTVVDVSVVIVADVMGAMPLDPSSTTALDASAVPAPVMSSAFNSA